MKPCDSIRERLADGLELDAELAKHADDCVACGALVATFRQLDDGLAALPAVTPPEALVTETLARVEKLEPESPSVFGALMGHLGTGLVSFGELLVAPFRRKGPRLALLVGVPALGALMVVTMTLGSEVRSKISTAGGTIAGLSGDFDEQANMPVQSPTPSGSSATTGTFHEGDDLTIPPATSRLVDTPEAADYGWGFGQAFEVDGRFEARLRADEDRPIVIGGNQRTFALSTEGLDQGVEHDRDLGRDHYYRPAEANGLRESAELVPERERTRRETSGEDQSGRFRTIDLTRTPIDGRQSLSDSLEAGQHQLQLDDGELDLELELDEAESPVPAFLPTRDVVSGLSFQPATGMWANTYVPGDPRWRLLARRLRDQGGAPFALATEAAPLDLRLPAPRTGALALSVQADRRRVEGRSRVLLQVGLRGAAARTGRRPTLRSVVLLDLRQPLNDAAQARVRGLLESISRRRGGADRVGIVVAGPKGGVLLEPSALRLGQVTVTLRKAFEGTEGEATSLRQAMSAAVGAVADTESPLGSGLVWVVSPSLDANDARSIESVAHTGALGGVATTTIGLEGADADALETLALAGHGRRWWLGEDADSLVRGEVEAVSRAVARAVRLNIALAPGVQLVDVLGSRRLGGAEADRVRRAEQALDQELARRLGIAADREQDDEGIQIVIPAFYADDGHTILLDLVVSDPGPVADVTVRYKDLLRLTNGEATERLELARGRAERGPREREVLRNLLTHELATAMNQAAGQLSSDPAGARATLIAARAKAQSARAELRALASDAALSAQLAVCRRYEAAIAGGPTPLLADSLRYASRRLLFGDPLEVERP